ncbi:hypothetical protein FS749_003498 [Ceratobasidium sp. UAMH 11750]|nr:hypothetical protein FS749_003498 [Ceratobasidium sp. UAMH 11750]
MPRVTFVSVNAGVQRRLHVLRPTGVWVTSAGTSNPSSNPTAPEPNTRRARYSCPYCTMWCFNESGRARHIMSKPACAAAQAHDVEAARTAREATQRAGVRMPLRTGVSWADAEGADEFPFPLVWLNTPAEGAVREGRVDPSMEGATCEGGADGPMEGVMGESADVASEQGASTANAAEAHNSPPRRRVTVEEVPDKADNPALHMPPGHHAILKEIGDGDNPATADAGEDVVDAGDDIYGECGEPFVESFSDPRAGTPINDSRAVPFDLRAYMKSVGVFASPKVFADVELLMTTKMTNEGRDNHLKSRRYRGDTPWPNVGAMMKAIDTLPHGPPWKAVTLNVPVGDEERLMVVYVRDVVGVIRELMGNNRFKRHMRYAPERHWTSKARRKRVFGEMWTGDWWWTMQMIMADPQATIALLIIASDKTNLSLISREQVASPVYLTIGNISKRIRRKLKARAQILIGYLPVEDFSDVKNEKERERLKGKLVHHAMEVLVEPLKQASREGVEMYCADGRLRRVYPILAAYIVDYPEQSLMACTSQGRCPICTATFRQRARYRPRPGRRRRKRNLEALRSYLATGDLKELDERGLKPWWPFWAHLPHTDFAGCITPNLLHQLHKGMFKSHLVKWVSRVLGKETVDDRMAAMTRASGMRHFKKGISKVEK